MSTSALLLLIAFNLVFTPRFAEFDNIRLQFVQVVPVAIIALGMALVIGTKGIDLSVGSVMAIASALLALYLGYGPAVAIAVAIAGGAAVGLVNGVLIARSASSRSSRRWPCSWEAGDSRSSSRRAG